MQPDWGPVVAYKTNKGANSGSDRSPNTQTEIKISDEAVVHSRAIKPGEFTE